MVRYVKKTVMVRADQVTRKVRKDKGKRKASNPFGMTGFKMPKMPRFEGY